MSEHVGYIVKINQLEKHPNADKLQLVKFFGEQVCVGLDTHEGDVGIYFPTDLQLSPEYCDYNHLCRMRQDGTKDVGYMDPNKRNVQAIRLRGEKSYGIYAALDSLAYTGVDLNSLQVGDRIDVVNGHEVCKKYIPATNKRPLNRVGNKTRKHKAPIAPLFLEHADTEQLQYHLSAFSPGDYIEITLKCHGTSQRTAYLPRLAKYETKGLLAKLGQKINLNQKLNPLKVFLLSKFEKNSVPVYEYGYVTGTRRTILSGDSGGYYGNNEFRIRNASLFEKKLLKGETVYYEVVGYVNESTTIMGKCDNKKLKDKDFIKKYGEQTIFSYGCKPGESKTLVYRMTMTNEDGDVVEYTPDQMRYRCEQMGVECVPVFYAGIIPEDVEDAGQYVMELAEQFYDGVDPIGKTHIREGVVVRIVNKPKFTAYKYKNFNFKVLENIIKVEAEAPDLEEAEDLVVSD